MDKIKITKDDILGDLVEMPEGYRIEKYKTQGEIKDENLARADDLEANLGQAPDVEDLVNYAKLDHPYYQTLKEIEQLRKQI